MSARTPTATRANGFRPPARPPGDYRSEWTGFRGKGQRQQPSLSPFPPGFMAALAA